MQAGRPRTGGGGGRRRQALAFGDVLPLELLGQASDPSGESGDSDPSSNGNFGGPAGTEAAPDADAAVAPPVAAAPEAPAAPDSPAPPAEPPPPYTSLARQQLQQRLKAAIAAGTGPTAAAASRASNSNRLSPADQPAQHRRRQSHAQQFGGGSRPGSARLPALSQAGTAPQAVAAAQSQLPPMGLQASVHLPAASHGFQLLLPSGLHQDVCSRQFIPTAQQSAAAGTAAPSTQAQQGVQRGLLALLLPPLTEQFAGILPVRCQGAAGATSLLVLPSDGPSSRQEALTAAAALEQLLTDPAGAAHRAAAWRQQLLLQSSSAALLGLTAEPALQQHAQQLRRPGREGAAPGNSSGSLVAGPSWLAGGSSNGGSGVVCRPQSSSAGDCSTAAVEAVRSSSSFLQQLSSSARSSSPLPPLVLPRVPSRLGGAAGAAGAAAGGSLQTDGSIGMLSSAALPSHVPCSTTPPAALPAQQQQQQQQQRAQQQQQPSHQPPSPPAHGDPAWEGYCRASVAAALTVCMAEAVRQVEVGCAERGRLLAQLWNSYTATLGATVRQQQAQVEEMLVANANLNAEASQLRWEARSAEFLRREINRLRKDKEAVSLQLQDAHQELAALQADLAAAAEQQQALEAYAQRRLAGLRWRWAAAAVLLPRRQAPPLLGHAGQLAAQHSSGSPLVQQLAALEAAATAGLQAWQQLREHRQRGRAEAALAAVLGAPGSSSSSSSSSGGGHAKPRMPSRLGASSSSSGSSSAAGAVAGHAQQPPLACLRPEARAAVLLSLPGPQRQQALAGMPDGERAVLVLHWDEATRAQVFVEMGAALAAATDAAIWRKPLLLARLLSSTPADQAATQLCSRASPEQQAAVLEVLPPRRGAALLLAHPAAAQQQFLGSASPRAAAALLEWVPPAASLQLLLPATTTGATEGASGGGMPCAAGTGPAACSACAAALLSLLPERQVSAMLALAQPWEAAALLHGLEPQPQLRLLQQLPPGPRAVAQVALQQLRAAEARQRSASVAAASSAAEPAVQTLADTAEPGQAGSEEAEAPPTPDVATSLIALFQQLSPAQKTHLLLMGSPGTAAPLLLHLQGGEVSDVMLLLPPQRQEALLLALHPAHEQRVRGLMRAAQQRRSSLLLPQHVAAAAAAAVAAEAGQAGEQQGGDEAPEGSLAGEFQRIRRASALALQPAAALRRTSLLAPNAAGALVAAAAAAAGSSNRPGSAAGRQRQGSRRGSLLAPPRTDTPQQRRGSRCTSSLA